MNDDPLGWMAHSDLRDGVTVTVVRGGDLGTVLAAFGAEGAGLPVDDPQIQWAAWESEGPLPWAVIAPVEGGVIAVEPNGFAGVAPPVLRVASR
ncbi:hypothetical protein, partial [Pseudactinotalea sp.]|uniref:hypothetical protein n=1 Tax=Pseudactinotalea sp. TaxID=1926260 RepID=UPI003B3A5EE9